MLVDLLTVAPVFVLILWFAFITIRDRRRGVDRRGRRRAATDLTALYLLVLPGGAVRARGAGSWRRRGYRVPALQQACLVRAAWR